MSQVTWTAVAGKLVHRAVLAPLGRQRSLVARRRGRAPLYEWRHVVYWAERMQAILDDWEDPAAQAEMVDIVDAGGPD